MNGQNSMTPAGASRMPQVVIKLEQLDKSLHNATALVEQLEARLATVLRPSSPDSNAKQGRDTQSVALAAAIELATDKIDAIGARLQQIIERVEI